MEKSQVDFNTLIGRGGEADIYAVYNRPDLAAKIYRKLPSDDDVRKFTFMVANPPIDSSAKNGRVSIAWLLELVTESGRVIGFAMSRLDLKITKEIFNYYIPATRRQQFPLFSYFALLRTAQNLSRAVRSIHSRRYVIGDINESNFLVAEDAIITLVDTDSFQFNDGITTHRCPMGKPEYTPPELQGFNFRDVNRLVEHDLFGLGVLIFQLLMEGTHPFDGVFTGQGESPEIKDRIKSGHFPHGKRSIPYKPKPLISFQMLPIALQELFLLCFEEGHRNPAARPTAEMWVNTLGEFENNLTKCSVNEQHFYSNHLSSCPWCVRTAKLGRDPFPSEAAVKSGQHLKLPTVVKSIAPNTYQSTPTKLTPKPSARTTVAPSPKIISSPQSTTRQIQSNTSTLQPSKKKPNHINFISFLIRKKWLIAGSSAILLVIAQIASQVYDYSQYGYFHVGYPLLLPMKLVSSFSLENAFYAHSKSVHGIAVSPDGETLVSGSEDETIKIWNLKTGNLLRTLSGGSNSSIAISPDGKTLVSGSHDIKVWNLQSGKLIYTIDTGNRWAKAVISPDGKFLVGVTLQGYDGSTMLKVWNLQTGQLIRNVIDINQI